MFGDDEAVVAGDRTGDPHGQVVRLGAGADEHTDAEIAGQCRPEPFRIGNDVFVQVARMRIEGLRLAAEFGDHVRVAVSDGRYVVVTVEVAPAVGTEQPDPFPPHQVHGLIVEQPVGGSESPFTASQQIVVVAHARTRYGPAPPSMEPAGLFSGFCRRR
jgi:hypothetical protein